MLPFLLPDLRVTKTPLWMNMTKNTGLPCPPGPSYGISWEGQFSSISHEPQLLGTDTMFQASAARQSGVLFFYPASADRAEALP